jgi:DNA-binding CsgD family transcriptional regulator
MVEPDVQTTEAILGQVALEQNITLIEVDAAGRVFRVVGLGLEERYKDLLVIKQGRLLFLNPFLRSAFEQLSCLHTDIRVHPFRVLIQRGGAGTAVATFYSTHDGHWFSLYNNWPRFLIKLYEGNCSVDSRRDFNCIGNCKRIWKLTNAEARLAHMLGSGMTVRDASETAGVTYNTARSRLKIVFLKTSSCSQNLLINKITTQCSLRYG